jgi:hypothetical protein
MNIKRSRNIILKIIKITVIMFFLTDLVFAAESTYLSRICEYDIQNGIGIKETGCYVIKSETVSYSINENMEVNIVYSYRIKRFLPDGNTTFGLSLRNRGMMHGAVTSDVRLNIINVQVNGRNVRVDYKDSQYNIIDDNFNPLNHVFGDEFLGEYFNNGYLGWYYFNVDFANSDEVNIEISYKTIFGLGVFDSEYIRYNSTPFWFPLSADAEIKILIENKRNNAFLSYVSGCSPADTLVTENCQIERPGQNTVLISYTPTWYSDNRGIRILFSDLYASRGSPNNHFFEIILSEYIIGGVLSDGLYLVSYNYLGNTIYDNISSRELKQYELIFLNGWQLRIMRNAFYAVHKYKFNDNTLNQILYYDYWDFYYQNTIPDNWFNANFTEATLSQIERRNVDIIRNLEFLIQ